MTQSQPDLYIGTMGWTYKDWLGPFYPQDTDQKDFLGYYAQMFNTVEIDSTFYFVPKPAVVSAWYARTPPEFKFTAKLPREVTHDKGLVEVDDVLNAFLKNISILGHKLGCLLVQLPPSFRYDEAAFDCVALFLDRLPASEFRFAVEFRHRSWIQAEVFEKLRERRIAWTIQDHPWYMPIYPELTADFTYIRWMGDHEDPNIPNVSQVVIDRTQDILKWAERLKREILPHVNTLYGFYNNHYAGHSPTNCNQMKRLLGLETRSPDADRQMSLF